MRYIADISGIDYSHKGYSHDWLLQQNMAFLISRCHVKIHTMPIADQKLTFATWERGTKGALALRDFDVYDEDGNIVVSSSSAWILVNPKTRHILRPSEFTGEMDVLADKSPGCSPAKKIKLPEMKMVGKRKIVYSDIDGNGHVYNANYLDIAMDFLPATQQKRMVKDFMINFNHEAKLGQEIEVFVNVSDEVCFVEGRIGDTGCFCCELKF
jgi:acyl-ACP thioesterase